MASPAIEGIPVRCGKRPRDGSMRSLRARVPAARGLALPAPRCVYMGDVSAESSQSTYCHACSAGLIGRVWYDMTAWS
jgi:hypothetical protein